MKLVHSDFTRIANYVQGFGPGTPIIDWASWYHRTFQYYGEVIPKERARTGKGGGRPFTPAATRKFEKAVKDWGIGKYMEPVFFPVKVDIVIHDFTDDPQLVLHSLAGVTYNTHRDLDNTAKSILDGLNKVAYQDDKQIVDLSITRRWATEPGFIFGIQRAGLSKNEYTNLLKFL